MAFPASNSLLLRSYKFFLIASSFGCVFFPVIVTAVCFTFCAARYGVALVIALALITVLPIPNHPPWFMKTAVQHAVWAAAEWLQIKVKFNADKFSEEGPYVIGREPHSVIPISVPAIMNTWSGLLPKACSNCHSLATSVVFNVPFARQVWWWLSIRPATRAQFDALLSAGKTVCLNPGGVQECLHMRPGHEVAFLTQRLGFIRMAIRHGAPLVPAFAFGQSDAYQYIKPGPPLVPQSTMAWLSRKIGFCPILFWGKWGTTAPLDVPLTIVLGDPIPTKKMEDPSIEICQKYNALFVKELERLFAQHREEAGHPNLELLVI